MAPIMLKYANTTTRLQTHSWLPNLLDLLILNGLHLLINMYMFIQCCPRQNKYEILTINNNDAYTYYDYIVHRFMEHL